MIRRAFLALAAAAPLSACLSNEAARAPLKEEAKLELKRMGLKVGAPMFVRIFKLENEMEIWLGAGSGRYMLFRTYPICNWSGDIGPKTAEGDKQAPEGFYVVTASQMNPDSEYFLSFNIGYPNAYDLANRYTGRHLMVHGGCRSGGCYAVTDEAIQEIFTLAREAFTAGQRRFPVHAFPFRMTQANMEFRRNHKWEPFWLNIKEGYDAFDASRQVPIVGMENRRYVFFAQEASVPAAFKRKNAGLEGPALISGW
jgi:murein L,D-transpeptidase YafK